MKRLSIKTSLVTIFATMAVVFVGFATLSIDRMALMNASTSNIVENWMPSSQIAAQIKLDTANLRISVRDLAISTGPAAKAEVVKRLDFQIERLKQTVASYEALVVSDEDRNLYNLVKDAVGNYLAIVPKEVELSSAGQDLEVRAFLEKADALEAAVVKSTGNLGDFNNQGAKLASEASQATYVFSFWSSVVASGIILILLASSTLFAIFGISKPIGRITASMDRLAAGDTESEIPFSGRADEIGSMAGAVEVFRQTALAKIASDRVIEANRSQFENDRVAQEQADRARAEAMAQATSGLAAGLKRLAAGDLSFQLTEAFAADFEALRQDFNFSVLQLANTLSSVADSVVSITNGSQEISTGAYDLSKRTEQQAAALEETAAALDQITANVTSSSKRAEDARRVATEANASAAKSGEVVGQAVNAMSRIEQSSNQISNIIGVIDEIAFQTNLLALNAGVEAARAGDAGKGFAVVAQEVRELAQRSANAAKEIKGLIQTSTTEVASGVKLVSETGTALKSIGEFIASIYQHMEAIALSSREQSVGLAEVNAAVNQMDQTTQQNAAMVEESSAAASSLANEAGNLRQLIGRFDLGNASGQSQALRQAASRMAAPTQPFPPQAHSRAPARKVASRGAVAAPEWTEF